MSEHIPQGVYKVAPSARVCSLETVNHKQWQQKQTHDDKARVQNFVGEEIYTWQLMVGAHKNVCLGEQMGSVSFLVELNDETVCQIYRIR